MSKPTDYFRFKNHILTTEGVSIEAIAKRFGTPVYVYSASSFLDPLTALQKGLTGLDHVTCFAVKSCSNVAILRLLARAGAGMDLVSAGELYRAKRAGVSASKIVFSGVGKTAEEMKAGLLFGGTGILSFNVESVAELVRLNEVAIKLKRRAPVCLRFNPNVDAKTHPYISTGLKKNKFGIRRDEILKIACEISDFPGIDLKGLSIHIGSQLLSLKPLNDAFAIARELMEELNEILSQPLSLMDLGGGVGITYKHEKTPTIRDYCSLIRKHFGPSAGLSHRSFRRNGRSNRPAAHPVKLIIEPGRVIAGNSGALISKVLYRKERPSKDFLIIDAAMNDLVRPALYGSYHEIVAVRASRSRSKKTDVVGPVCESSDCFASDRKLPVDLSAGQCVALLSAGAYGFTMASNYNSRPRPAEVLVHKGKARLIRARESFEDLVRGERV